MPKFSKYIYYEIAAWLLGILGLIVLLWEPLSGQGILKHDNIKWNFPVFKFFIETLNGGELPLWNPFSNAGLPFFPVASQMRLWEPLHILFAFVGPLFTKDIVSLYVANRVLHSLVMVLGIYLLLRSYTKYLIVRLSLIPILLYSSIFLGSFRQDGIINQFLWAGYSTYFLLQLLKTEKWKPHHVFGFILQK